MPYLFRWRRERLTLLLWLCLLLLAITASVLSLTAAYRHVRQQDSSSERIGTDLGMQPSLGETTNWVTAARSGLGASPRAPVLARPVHGDVRLPAPNTWGMLPGVERPRGCFETTPVLTPGFHILPLA